ncbi:hypothetical protein KAFR_0B02230 [Kazachstania africana CBS 2517]|uniref:Uncharacterized protein n=1 Tax=Kazachstania africana (strain ATCC 22294 / BCRC 22015 / CBS 2517 / CECT 1963 / NBRC 1671 / NRRL Y-8276) TaxID=1071382 RepID=H2AQ71_KAZAF|nr:hypothetical protein KAFR_0B02230 [Kazachstania africana CBS 2517]CCF56521.1 hypothetical protein KAFR_0B02230 [Kazachstania africana CBS 2517]
MDRNVYEACNNLIKEFQTHKISADEILSQKVNHLVPIPFKSREDLDNAASQDRKEGLFKGDIIPRIDLKVLHYFVSQLCLLKYPQLVNSFDETSLITLGLLVEKFLEDFLISNKPSIRKRRRDEDSEDDSYSSSSESSDDSEEEGEEEEDIGHDEQAKENRIRTLELDAGSDEDNEDGSRSVSGGPSEMLSKLINYRDAPTDI